MPKATKRKYSRSVASKYSRSVASDVKNEMHRYKRGTAIERSWWQRRQGQEPRAGDCNRPFKGPQERQEGPSQEGVIGSVLSHDLNRRPSAMARDRICRYETGPRVAQVPARARARSSAKGFLSSACNICGCTDNAILIHDLRSPLHVFA
jgi:hypothetical protein